MTRHLLIQATRGIVERIARGEFAEAVRCCVRSRLSAADLSRVIRDYGRTPAPPTREADDALDAVPIDDASPPAWSVYAPLWTVEEGRSDLTLILTVTIEAGEAAIELDDLHVL